jgi:membrane protease YdiL (CAAX protease family)
MMQEPNSTQREADRTGVPPTLSTPPESPLVPDEFVQMFRLVGLTLALYFLYTACLSLAFSVLRDSGFYAWYYGPKFVSAALASAEPDQAAFTRLQWWAIALALPCWLTPTALLFYYLPAGLRSDIGLSLRKPATQVLWGVGAWLIITPPVLGVNLLVSLLYESFSKAAPVEHPFTSAAESGAMRPLEWVVLALGVAVAAPLWEELLFRGLLPALFGKLRNGGHAAMTLAILAALLLSRKQLLETLDVGGPPLFLAAMPVLFVLALVPVYAIVYWRSRTATGPVVFGTALLFAAVHSFAWPTPVALFILGLGLGWLAVWRRSLVAPIVVHGLFNTVSYLLLFIK